MTGERETLSEYCERQCRDHVWWKTVPGAGAGNPKISFADGRERSNGGTACWLE